MSYKSSALFFLLCCFLAACKQSETEQPVCALSNNTYYYYGSSELMMPNAFTPNGDGRNDLYRPVFMANNVITSYRLEIRDKSGTVVYASTDTSAAGWDGRNVSGEQLPPGRYSASVNYATYYGGSNYSSGFCIALLSYNGKSCIPRSSDGEYFFADMYDPYNRYFSYSTAETICN